MSSCVLLARSLQCDHRRQSGADHKFRAIFAGLSPISGWSGAVRRDVYRLDDVVDLEVGEVASLVEFDDVRMPRKKSKDTGTVVEKLEARSVPVKSSNKFKLENPVNFYEIKCSSVLSPSRSVDGCVNKFNVLSPVKVESDL